jgi:hypothetical protein
MWTRADTPVSFIHQTGDGPVHLLVRASRVGWDSLHWGRRLAGTWTFPTMAEANEYVLRRFQDLYYGHRCNAACRPVDAISSHKSDDLWGIIQE